MFLAALRPLRLTATVSEIRSYLRATTRTVLHAHWGRSTADDLASIDDFGELSHTAEQFARETVAP